MENETLSKNGQMFIDSEEDEVFIGPITTREVSRMDEDSLECSNEAKALDVSTCSQVDIYADLSLMKLDETSGSSRDALNEFFCEVSELTPEKHSPDTSYNDSLDPHDSGCADISPHNETDSFQLEVKSATTVNFEDSLREFESAEEECHENSSADIDCGGKYYDELAAMLEMQAKFVKMKEAEDKEEEIRKELDPCPSKIPLPEKPAVKSKKVQGNVMKNKPRKDPAVSKLTQPMRKVFNNYQSPVAKYIHENPAPALFKTYCAKDCNSSSLHKTAKKKLQLPKVSVNKENELPKSRVKATKKWQTDEADDGLKSVLPVANYCKKTSVKDVMVLDEITENNTRLNCNLKQYFPSPTVVRHCGTSKVIKWAKCLEIKDDCETSRMEDSSASFSNEVSLSQDSKITDATVLDVKLTSRTNTLNSKARFVKRC